MSSAARWLRFWVTWIGIECFSNRKYSEHIYLKRYYFDITSEGCNRVHQRTWSREKSSHNLEVRKKVSLQHIWRETGLKLTRRERMYSAHIFLWSSPTIISIAFNTLVLSVNNNFIFICRIDFLSLTNWRRMIIFFVFVNKQIIKTWAFPTDMRQHWWKRKLIGRLSHRILQIQIRFCWLEYFTKVGPFRFLSSNILKTKLRKHYDGLALPAELIESTVWEILFGPCNPISAPL